MVIHFKYSNVYMGKTRDLFKKIRDKKGTFHAKMDIIAELCTIAESARD